MSMITVKNLSKGFKHYSSIRGRIWEWLLLGRKPFHKFHWVLKDINFTVQRGETVGIIGMNGAGKSTLLKIITGTCRPTSGEVISSGKIAALLELGLGFHPEFTGRQNVLLAGQLLGHSTKELQLLLPEIEAFAEIGTHFDQPLRTYSSGMQVRLAFSLSTVVKPDVLIVDEALSVGDTYFQHKCYKRIRELRSQGTTLLFVSHDNAIVSSLCDRAVLLHAGGIAMEGKTDEVIDYYNALLADFEKKNTQQILHESGKIQTISGTKEAAILEVSLFNQQNEAVRVVNVGEAIKLCIKIRAQAYLPELTLGYQIKDHLGQAIFGTNTYHLDHHMKNIAKDEIHDIHFSFSANLGPGSYSISVALHTGDQHMDKNYEWRDLALIFTVINLDKTTFIGTSWLPPVLSASQLSEEV
jgi:lipopolysaccharide transport system ATP-binding protein